MSKRLGIQNLQFPVKIFIKTAKTIRKNGSKKKKKYHEDSSVTCLPGDLAYDVTPPLAAGWDWWSPHAHHRNFSQKVDTQSAK